MDGLLIGRFQPFHLGHQAALEFALSKIDKLYVGIGSSNKPLQRNNPFSAKERKAMIMNSIDDLKRITIYDIPDAQDHLKWIKIISQIVPKFDIIFSNDDLTRHLYSKMNVQIMPIPFLNRAELSGTYIRDLLIHDKKWDHLVPMGTKNFLANSAILDRLKHL